MEADALSWIDWEKCDKTIQADSIHAIAVAAITGQVANHIKAIPCNPQAIDSLLLSIPDTTIINTAITWSFEQSHLTCLEAELCVSETVSKLDDSSCPVVDNDPQLNPKCMTTFNWVEAQS